MASDQSLAAVNAKKLPFNAANHSSEVRNFGPSSPEAFCLEYGRFSAGAIARKAVNSTP